MISIRSFGVAWPLQSMELSLHAVEVTSISTRNFLLPSSLFTSAIPLRSSFSMGSLPDRLICLLIRYGWHS